MHPLSVRISTSRLPFMSRKIAQPGFPFLPAVRISLFAQKKKKRKAQPGVCMLMPPTGLD
jgi:hypothetical protein